MATDDERERIAQETAEYIAAKFTGPVDDDQAIVHVMDIRLGRPPADIAQIKQDLLEGRLWVSWLDGHVVSAMKQMAK